MQALYSRQGWQRGCSISEDACPPVVTSLPHLPSPGTPGVGAAVLVSAVLVWTHKWGRAGGKWLPPQRLLALCLTDLSSSPECTLAGCVTLGRHITSRLLRLPVCTVGEAATVECGCVGRARHKLVLWMCYFLPFAPLCKCPPSGGGTSHVLRDTEAGKARGREGLSQGQKDGALVYL